MMRMKKRCHRRMCMVMNANRKTTTHYKTMKDRIEGAK